ncbi:MAG: helix-turn-helix domain-containing protein [Acidimicrobiia bacterium]
MPVRTGDGRAYPGAVEGAPLEEGLYPPILTTAHVAEMMHCTIGDVRDKVHRGELEALRWGQQFRFFREEVIASMTRYQPGDPTPDDENIRVDTERN